MQPQSVVFLQPRLGQVPEDELKKAGYAWRSLPAEPDALSAYDCIILGDVAPEQLPLADRLRLEKYVGDRGGTLVVLAGKRSMPLAYAGVGDGGPEGDPLMRLLPIEQPQVGPPRGRLPGDAHLRGQEHAVLADGAGAGSQRAALVGVPAPLLGRGRQGQAGGHAAGLRRRQGGRARQEGRGRAGEGARPDRAAQLRLRPRALRGHRQHLALALPHRRHLSPPLLGAGDPLGGVRQAAGHRQRLRPLRHARRRLPPRAGR